MPRPFFLLFVTCCLGLAATERCRAQLAANFTRDVQPILEQHCWKCHGEQRAAGGLRLDQKHLAERGGGSGKNVLALNVKTNELLRRVRSTDDELRMPPKGPPLTTAEIAMLERWIAQGAAWPLPPEPKTTSVQPPASIFDRWIDAFDYAASRRYRPAYFAAMAILFGMIFVERAKEARRKGKLPIAPGLKRAIAKRLARLSRAWYLVGFAGIAIFVAVQYAREQAQELQRQRLVNMSARRGQPQGSGQGMHDPYRPVHPPRLGGTYYRGNDERSEDLFNGGYYRTATFHVHLADAEGNDLAWGDPLPEKPHIRFQIIRAPHSSPSLFTPEIMENAGLSAVQPEQVAEGERVPLHRLQTDIPGESWSALFPLAPIPAQGKRSGKIYLYKGSPPGGAAGRDEPSYLIGYELSARDGEIAPESQIWMASVYNVASLQWPERGRIPADHWFDFRPIPEIEK